MKKDIKENERDAVMLSAPNIIQNIKNFYDELPQSSSIKSSVMSLTNKFHTFVIVIISDKEIEIPEELRNFIINPENQKP